MFKDPYFAITTLCHSKKSKIYCLIVKCFTVFKLHASVLTFNNLPISFLSKLQKETYKV